MQRDVEHVRVKIYDVVPNVLTSWTYDNLMNKENKVQKINNTMSLLTQFGATHLCLGDTNSGMNPL